MEERTGWRGQNESQIMGEEKRNGRLVGAVETSKKRAEWLRLQRKNLAYWACRKGKSGLSATESSWQVRRSLPCQKQKEQSRQSKAPDHEGGERQGGREPHFGERVGDQSESMEWKGWTPP